MIINYKLKLIVDCLNDNVATCGADEGAGFVWASLTQLGLPYNALTHLDKSLEYTPWLKSIELSHNALNSAKELEFLPNIKNINLSYNNLVDVPHFHKSAYNSIKKLILKNNYLENTAGNL